MYEFLNGIYDFVDKNIKVIKIITAGVLSLGFIGSVALSIFSGGEFKDEVNVEEAKGILTIAEAKYSTSYIAGDKFSFDKENAKIQLLAKDPLIETMVIIDELPESEYGFKVNGEGEIIVNPADITLSKEVDTIDVVSVVYPTPVWEKALPVAGRVISTVFIWSAVIFGIDLLLQVLKASVESSRKLDSSNED